MTWYDERYRWVAKIRVDGKLLHLGYFDKVIDAAKARWEAEKKYDFPGCNTSSSALMYIRERRNG